jgi:DNA adenine methylase
MAYTGGKSSGGMFQWIINNIPPHDHFISGFLGNCPVFRNLPERVDKIGFERSKRVIDSRWNNYASGIIKNENFLTWFRSHYSLLGPETFIYLDPPYLMETRSCSRNYYEFELSDKDHDDLLQLCLSTRANVAISHYSCSKYEEALSGWNRKDRMLQIRTGKRLESLYMNYPEPTKLHTYKYYGENRTMRQMFKRRAKNYADRVAKMDALQRSYFEYLISEAMK